MSDEQRMRDAIAKLPPILGRSLAECRGVDLEKLREKLEVTIKNSHKQLHVLDQVFGIVHSLLACYTAGGIITLEFPFAPFPPSEGMVRTVIREEVEAADV